MEPYERYWWDCTHLDSTLSAILEWGEGLRNRNVYTSMRSLVLALYILNIGLDFVQLSVTVYRSRLCIGTVCRSPLCRKEVFVITKIPVSDCIFCNSMWSRQYAAEHNESYHHPFHTPEGDNKRPDHDKRHPCGWELDRQLLGVTFDRLERYWTRLLGPQVTSRVHLDLCCLRIVDKLRSHTDHPLLHAYISCSTTKIQETLLKVFLTSISNL